jgi:cytochrome P450
MSTVSLPQGPRGPAVLQLAEFTRRPLPFLEECAEKYGDPFTVRMPGLGTFVMASAPDLVRQIFTGDPDRLQAGAANELIEPIVGPNSILRLDGERHLRERRLLSPPMRGERMHAYAAVMAKVAEAEIRRMPVGRAFSLHPHMQAITLDVILHAVLGAAPGPRTRTLRALLVEMLEPPPAVMAFIPRRWLDFPGSPYRAFLRRRAAVDHALRALVRERREAPPGDDILSLMLAARDESGAPMTDDELSDELITMLVAGHETTATALSWAVACILEHPAVHARVAGGRDADYLDAVIKETLRLRPILPDVVRRLREPMRFAGYELPAGVNLTPCIHLAHRRPESWPEPDAFRPDRFVGAKVDPYTWFPFGGGVRRCLGMAFAMFEMRVVLGALFAHTELRLAAPGAVKVVRRTFTLAPDGGTRVVMGARRVTV